MEQLNIFSHQGFVPTLTRFRVFILLLVFSWVGCAAPSVRPPLEEASLKTLCELHDIEWRSDNVGQVITLDKQGLLAKVMVGSSVVMVNNQKVTLSSPVRRSKDKILVPPDFKQKVIDELLRRIAPLARRFKEIIIDPGHGGYDPGAMGRDNLVEKNITLDIAKRLKQNLENQGIQVTLTRSSDVFISLEDRVALVSRLKGDLFVSIHVNSSRAKSAHGFEVYHLRDIDQLKWGNEVKPNSQEMFNHFAMQKNSPVLEKILLDMIYVHKQAESKQLAGRVAAVTADGISSENRGVKSSEFFVLKNTLIPAILVEVGFLSNQKEGNLLESSEYRQKIADNLGKSILNYASY